MKTNKITKNDCEDFSMVWDMMVSIKGIVHEEEGPTSKLQKLDHLRSLVKFTGKSLDRDWHNAIGPLEERIERAVEMNIAAGMNPIEARLTVQHRVEVLGEDHPADEIAGRGTSLVFMDDDSEEDDSGN